MDKRRWWMGAGATIQQTYEDLGLEYIQSNARYFYNFTNTTGSNGAAISNGNAGLNDLSPNNRDATIIGTPVVRDLALRYGTTIKTLSDTSTNAVSIGSNGSAIFNSSFEVWFVVETQDGQPSASHNYFGGIIPTNVGVNLYCSTDGRLTFAYGNSDGVFQKRTTDTILQNGVNGLNLLRVVVDFENDQVEFYLNGYNVPSTYFAGTIAGKNPANWTNTSNIYVGALNNNGTTTSSSHTASTIAHGVTPLLTDQEALYVQAYLMSTMHWRDEITISSLSDVSTMRANLIDAVTNGNGLAAFSPTVTTSYTGAMHIADTSNITGASSWTRLEYSMNDIDGFSWTNRCYFAQPTVTRLNILIINTQGHNSDNAAGHETWMSQLLAEGYDVLWVALPIAGSNTENNPNITLTSTSGHDQILSSGLDRVGFNAMELYFFDKTSSITYLDNLYNYNSIFATGISGGGWFTTLISAMDTRVDRGVCVRGTLPASLKDNSLGIYQEGDYEQGGSMFTQARCGPRVFDLYTTYSYLDMYIMASSNGKRFKYLSQVDDTCCFKGTSSSIFAPAITSKATQLGGVFEQVTGTDSANSAHQYHLFDRTEMLEFLQAI